MNKRIVAVAVACLLVGAIIGPPVVDAATQLVTIKGAGSKNKAKVTRAGAIKVDTEADVEVGFLHTLSLTTPLGVATIVEGTANATVPADFGVITNAVLDLPSGAGPVTVTLEDTFGEIWQGTVDDGGRHLNDTFDSGLIWVGNLDITVTGSGAQYSLDGLVVSALQGEDLPGRQQELERLRKARLSN
ncbi:MAG: hypothetical protein ACRDKB_05645 [Actinomycetota bacterium]